MTTSSATTTRPPSATDRPPRSPWPRRGGVPWRPPRGLLEPYDLAVLAAILAAAAASVVLGENLLLPRRWMIGHIWTFFLSGVGLLTLLMALRLIAQALRQGGVLAHADVRQQATRHLHWRGLARLARFCVALEVVALTATVLKQRIPRLNPGLYDTALIEFETLLHLGLNPAWALAGLDWPRWAAVFMDQAYIAWFPAKGVAVAYVITHRNTNRRDRFLLAYLSLWTAGILLGLLLPSNGPFFVSPEAFPVPGMDIAQQIQQNLRTHYETVLQPGQSGALTYGWGLMALPSLHVAAVTLYALFAWSVVGGSGSGATSVAATATPATATITAAATAETTGTGSGTGTSPANASADATTASTTAHLLRWATITFAALTFLGSLITGWHYAIDGYAAALIALGAWWVAGRVVGWLGEGGSRKGDGPLLADGGGR